MGDIVHRSLEVIVKALTTSGCTAVASPAAVAVMKELGGYSEVLRRQIAEQVAGYEDNPRAVGQLDALARELRKVLPEMREKAQATLSRTELVAGSNSDAVQAEAGDLPDGSYPEFVVRVEALKVSGRIDLLTVDGPDVRLVDYKTGAPTEHHADQLRMYALLWSRSKHATGARALATHLTLAYSGHDVDVPVPDVQELSELEIQLLDRLTEARGMLASDNPVPRPAPDTCQFCPVRHLCEAYWSDVAPDLEPAGFIDVEISVKERNGPKSWLVHAFGEDALLRTSEEIQLDVGATLRVLGAYAAQSDEDLLVLSLLTGSELFAVE
jgi:hypothetical protein